MTNLRGVVIGGVSDALHILLQEGEGGNKLPSLQVFFPAKVPGTLSCLEFLSETRELKNRAETLWD